MIETARNQALHSLLLEPLLVHVCLQVQILILDLMVVILQFVKLFFVPICLHLQLVLMFPGKVLLTPLRIVLLSLQYLL